VIVFGIPTAERVVVRTGENMKGVELAKLGTQLMMGLELEAISTLLVDDI